MKTQFRIPAALLLAMFLFGCGQTGPLYVSGNPSTIQPVAEQPSAEEEEKDAEDSESQ
jgi:predicted small lipoprotein YifL